MGIPIMLIKTKLDSKGGRYKPRNFSCKYWYPCKSDAKLSKSEFLMFASNGFDVVVPRLPTPIAELKKTVDIFKDNMKEGLELCLDILEMTPNSPLKSAFKTIESSLLTAKTLCQGTVLTTGAADLTGIASKPVIMPVGHHQGTHLHSLHLFLQQKKIHKVNQVKKGTMRVMGIISALQRRECLLLLNNLNVIVVWNFLTMMHWKST